MASLRVSSRPIRGGLKALLKLANGPHELTLGERTTRFFVGPNAPAEFKPFR